ncbi:MAG: glycosyltransferase family 4 protein [Desulfofustis sp.]|nr:glycosyltransferase family 4 protein [Desulfofustis sp.]
MRIGVNTLFLVPGDVGGTEIYLRENLKCMVVDNREVTFVLFTSRDNNRLFCEELSSHKNVEFVQLPFISSFRPLRIIIEQTLLPWKAWTQKIDVLWSPGYTAPLWCSCPQVVTIHDLQYKTHPDDVSFLERLTLDFLVKNACRVCDAIITVSNFSKVEVVRFNFAPEHKVFVIYEAADPGFGEKSNKDVSSFMDLPPDTPYILCVAHTYPHKRVHVLVEAFGILADDETMSHHLVLIGKPRRGEDDLQKSLDTLKNRHKVHRIKVLEYDELKSIYQHADLFVLPSAYEGFGLPVLEALLASVPVITTRNASLAEVGGEHVFYPVQTTPDSLAESVKEVLSLSQDAREEWIDQGKTWAMMFSWEKSAGETIKVLNNIASKSS